MPRRTQRRRIRKVSKSIAEREMEIKERMLRRLISTASGRNSLAAAMTVPIKKRLDYASIGRKALYVQPMPAPDPRIYTYKGDWLEETEEDW